MLPQSLKMLFRGSQGCIAILGIPRIQSNPSLRKFWISKKQRSCESLSDGQTFKTGIALPGIEVCLRVP